jgi:hypothetical protein
MNCFGILAFIRDPVPPANITNPVESNPVNSVNTDESSTDDMDMEEDMHGWVLPPPGINDDITRLLVVKGLATRNALDDGRNRSRR